MWITDPPRVAAGAIPRAGPATKKAATTMTAASDPQRELMSLPTRASPRVRNPGPRGKPAHPPSQRRTTQPQIQARKQRAAKARHDRPSPGGHAHRRPGSAEVTPAGPRARTILTYSESANPASPHYTDQTVLFSHKQWVTERFTQAQITSDPQLTITILRGQRA
jgi:Penicillin amidase